jgi:hypothetical protein
MSYNDATKKKKIKSWNKIVPLNKPMVARIDEIFTESNYVQVSIAYFTKSDVKLEEDEENLQVLLMKKFNEVKVLVSIIKKMCYKINIDFNTFWYNIIHQLDKNMKEEDINGSLFEYYNDNFNFIKELINEKYNDENIINFLEKMNEEKPHKIVSKIGIISLNGIEHTINIIKNTIDNNKNWEFNFKYETPPYYILESNSINSSKRNHEEFIEFLNNEAKKNNTSLFTKIEYIGNKL